MPGDGDSSAEEEFEIALPSDSVPAALDKTVTDQEHDIAFLVEEARESAMRGNFFKAEALLKRICKLTTRLHGAASLDLAAHLSKLAAVQDSAGKAIEAKLSWNRALYIFEINRAPSPNPASASSAKNRSKRRRAIKKEMVQMAEKEVGQAESGKEDHSSKFAASERSSKKAAKKSAAAKAKAPPSSQHSMNVEPRKKQPKPIALQVLYKIPHWSMQSADAAVINTTHIHTDQLTPRTRQAIIERDVNPNHLRIRDLHSFYSENPKMDLNERRRKFVHWCKRREFLWKELLEDRYVLDLSLQSQGRLDKMEAEFAQMAARRKAKIFGLDKGQNFDAGGVTKSVLPPPSWDFQFKGSVAAAIDASTFVSFRLFVLCLCCACSIVRGLINFVLFAFCTLCVCVVCLCVCLCVLCVCVCVCCVCVCCVCCVCELRFSP